MPIDFPPIACQGFSARASSEGDSSTGRRATLALIGNADESTREHVQRAVTTMREQAAVLGVQEVAVDMRELEFMNSSCFKCLITWLSDLLEQPEERRYQIRFLSDATKHWQHRSLRALSCFATDLVSIET
ncbi:hypothetical protein [Paraliomyxa miuraensis]|uniref:hypothetical protein n=1 Tax=Paraliomyxa miuraensis TaxID=376150 RepID=UPI002257B5AD|nr:hypothetical protein [Paraliomyxa miuraensis]MCX4245894.1 hypothetical protein [Paraliomyxa miuraensis]